MNAHYVELMWERQIKQNLLLNAATDQDLNIGRKEVNIHLDIDGSSGDKTLELDMAQAMDLAYRIFKQRQEKYGPGNIAAFGEVGCVVRATDKLARLRNLYINGVGGEAFDETSEDTWLDLANYALIGLLCQRGKWPGWKPTQRSLGGSQPTTPLDPTPAHGSCTCSGLGATTR